MLLSALIYITSKVVKTKEERYSRVPRLSDTRYSSSWSNGYLIVEVLDYSVLPERVSDSRGTRL